MKYITLNGDVYVKTDRLTFRRFVELIVAVGIAKCQHLYISAYNLLHVLRSL